jgi:hypothetical protein
MELNEASGSVFRPVVETSFKALHPSYQASRVGRGSCCQISANTRTSLKLRMLWLQARVVRIRRSSPRPAQMK